jgi:hypothetical protein
VVDDTTRIVQERWRETAVWTLIAAALVAWLTRKGITTYFFAEAFVYLGSYHEAGNSFVGAVMRPHAAMFFRPSLWAVNLAWNLIAPPDPLLYHLRNVVFVVINAMLLHRLLLRFITDRFGRGVAMTFYAISKVHLTTIGYVATFSTILLLFATLSMFLTFCRWLEQRRWIDFVGTLFFTAFLIGSKDYGAIAIALLPLLAWARGAKVWRAMRPFALPLLVLVVVYVSARAWVDPDPAEGDYQPRIDARVIVKKSVQAATTLSNTSLFESGGRTGARGITRLVWADDSRGGRIAEGIVLLAFVAFGIASIVRARPPLALLVFCIAWGALFFAPTLLGRNEQLYYHNDLVAACAVLLGASVAWRRLTIATLIVLALNAEVSQQSMRYTWYELSEKLRALESYRDTRADHIIFVANDPSTWEWALNADGHAPFVQTLFGRPELQVQVVDRRAFRGDADALVIDVDRWRASR